ncbi:MAG TPA: hypothetical protein VMG12_38490, partial [Polyangiaceae bacterium]|nr:hypothetical protein [Polyangiaceae bacterium]
MMELPGVDRPDPLPDDERFVRLARAATQHYWLPAGAELGPRECLLLRRFQPKHSARRAVLLVHGASANSRTFLVPRGGFVRHLL